MEQGLTETLAKLADRNLSAEEASALLASLENKELRLDMQFQRHNKTFAMNAPDAYRGGQTMNGKAGQHEVQVLVPEKDEKAVRALTYGAPLSLVVRYLEFDNFYRRATFTGSLPDEPKKNEPVETPKPEEEASPAPEPDPVTEDEPPSTGSPPPEATEPEATPTVEEDPPAKPEPPAPSPVKPKTGEMAVFASPELPVESSASIAEKASVRSSEIIACLAHRTQSTKEEAAQVVDGFWDYLAEVKAHYAKHTRAHTLVIPHFGSFRFRFRRGNTRILEFLPAPEDSANRGMPGSSWVDQWSGKPQGLSVRRRISVFVAEQSGLPLKKADALLNQLLETVKALYRNRAAIHWARRGTMRESKTRGGREVYSFFASAGFLERLQVPPEPVLAERPEHSHGRSRSKRSSHGQGKGARPRGYKAGKPPMPTGQKMIMKGSGCGCLALPLIASIIGSGHIFNVGVFLGFLFLALLVKRALCHKE